MRRMFSKNRSSRRKDKNCNDGSNSSNVEAVGHSSGSLSRAQAEALYSNNTSPARSSSTGHSPSYSGAYGNGSMERPPRGRAMSDGSPAEFAVSSPLDFPMEHLQSFNATYGLNPSQRTYIDSRSIPRHTPLKSLISPTHSRSISSSRGNTITQSQSHARASSTSSLGNSLRERSLERIERENAYLGDASLDRHFEQMQLNMQMDNRLNQDTRYNTTGRDRSLDREYPHMGARSLERDPHSVSRSRSMDRGGEYNYPSATLPTMPLLSHPSSIPPSDHSSHEFRNSLVFEMQVQISDLHKEVSKLQKDLDHSREKLSSSMNSIKTFWSPELKKERAVRKEEAARCNLLNEQLKVAEAELRRNRELLRELEERVQGGAGSAGPAAAQEMASLKQERELQCRELLILKKTVEELEIRIDSQKQTLEARDESIKKLLEMLHNKGVNVAKEITRLKDSRPDSSGHSDDHKLQAKLEAKDSRIAALEREVQQLEDRLLKAKEEGAGLPPSSRETSLRDLASAKEKLLKVELQGLRSEVNKKDAELAGLRLKLDSMGKQQAEREEYVSVLKDQVTAKENQSTMIQADMEGLQDRLKTKEDTIERKSKECQASQAEKRRVELEVMELRDQLEVKVNRVNNLQRKIEGLEDTIREKEDQLSQARIRLTSAFTESPSDGTLSALEDALVEKDKQIEKLKEQREKSEQEHQEETDGLMKKSLELKANLDSLQKELTAKQTEICELREQTTELQAGKFEQESRIRKLESEVHERQADFQRVTLELEEALAQAAHVEEVEAELDSKRRAEAGQPANFSQQETKQLQSEVDRLQESLREAEADRADKEAEIKELQEIVKEYKQKMGTLKRSQQTEKKKNAQLLEEARKREDSMTDESSSLSTAIKKSTERVEELEEALRQSVIITAEREMAMAELQTQIEDSKTAMEEMRAEVEMLQHSSQDYQDKLAQLSRQLEDKDNKLRRVVAERQRQMQEVLETKQEALQATISEKDSTLALLEMTSTKNQKNMEEIDRLTQEKHKLQSQLREVTTSRMKLMHRDSSREKGSRSSSRSASARSSPTPPAPVPDKAKSAGSSPTEQPPLTQDMEATREKSSTDSTPMETAPESVATVADSKSPDSGS
ncbi:ERC protein 2 isoform X2 [Aplysia californica]|uniref:ERC protein 2 isoform X2 n=1 Tax=Aplysia californica TaxID=6500 RepID=A0ABM0JX72_APLCA|nr:ERC protein 2 isoform X2 [Aplysia californica]